MINLVSKDAADIAGTEVGARYASFNTQEVWALHGGSYSGVDVVLAAQFLHTDGPERIIERDAQSFLDDAFDPDGTMVPDASLVRGCAPGAAEDEPCVPVQLRRKLVDSYVDVSWRGLRVRTGVNWNFDVGNGAGSGQAIDPGGQIDSSRISADISYTKRDLADDWDLLVRLSGLDMGRDTINQRVYPPGAFRGALVFSPSETVSGKLLYGRAFRAPSFSNLHVRGNPVSQGNPDLGPETIDIGELGLSYSRSGRLRLGATAFVHQANDLINFAPVTEGSVELAAANVGEQTGLGGELEARLAPLERLVLSAHYSYLYSTFGDGTRAANVPAHQLYGRLDADVREPSPGPQSGRPEANIPNDLPLAGRSVYAELSARF